MGRSSQKNGRGEPGTMRPLPEVARNILTMLTRRPDYYRNFGIWWWPIKRFLKESGYTRHDFHGLGDYEDPEGATLTPTLPIEQMLTKALAEQNQNARYNLGRNTVEDLDGQRYVVYDQDVGL